jgi:hypothetical protein
MKNEASDSATQRVERLLGDWFADIDETTPVEQLSDEDVLVLSEARLNYEQTAEMKLLLARRRINQLDRPGRERLEELMTLYQTTLVLRARALKVAVERGIRPPLRGSD